MPLTSIALVAGASSSVAEAAPALQSQKFYTGVVSGGPDDLVVITGSEIPANANVIYRKIGSSNADNTNLYYSSNPPAAPTPVGNDVVQGYAVVVDTTNAPQVITVRLPHVIAKGQPYAIWVQDPNQKCGGKKAGCNVSNPVVINDARPLWFSPPFVYAEADDSDFSLARGASRDLTIVGRNLEPMPGHVTKVRLSAPGVLPHEWDAVQHPSEPSLDKYAATITIDPGELPVGSYQIEVSRDSGLTWVPWTSQVKNSQGIWVPPNGSTKGHWLPTYTTPDFEIRAIPPTPPVFWAHNQGTGVISICRPDDGADDTWCIARALHLAEMAGGGTVALSGGAWDINPPYTHKDANGYYTGYGPQESKPDCSGIHTSLQPEQWFCLVSSTPYVAPNAPQRTVFIDGKVGIEVPPNVNLVGSSDPAHPTYLVRGADFKPVENHSLFTLTRDNQVRDIIFSEGDSEAAASYHSNALAIGCRLEQLIGAIDNPNFQWCVAEPLENILIDGNTFEWMDTGIWGPARKIERLTLTNNVFGAYHYGIDIIGDTRHAASALEHFNVKDSEIRGNIFYPGGYVPVTCEEDGAIASRVHGAERLVFAGNEAHGEQQGYNINAATDPGFRAAFFFASAGLNDMMLVANNTGNCTGDKRGDGEFIAFDDADAQLAFYESDANFGTHAESVPIVNYGTEAPGDHYVDLQGTLTDMPFGGAAGKPKLDIGGDPESARKFFVGTYLSITNGQGIGQVRKITAIHRSGSVERVQFEPWLDVVPALSGANHSFAQIGTLGFHVYGVANTSDQSAAIGCSWSNGLPSNKSGKYYAGVIGAYNLAHSSFDDNLFVDAGGLYMAQVVRYGAHHFFTEIVGNQIYGEPSYFNYCSTGGISLPYVRDTPTSPVPLPTIGNAKKQVTLAHGSVGIKVADNYIQGASAARGGAISAAYAADLSGVYVGMLSAVIYHNAITGLAVAPPGGGAQCQGACQPVASNGGEEPAFWKAHLNACVDLSPFAQPSSNPDRFVQGTVIHANRCDNVPLPPQPNIAPGPYADINDQAQFTKILVNQVVQHPAGGPLLTSIAPQSVNNVSIGVAHFQKEAIPDTRALNAIDVMIEARVTSDPACTAPVAAPFNYAGLSFTLVHAPKPPLLLATGFSATGAAMPDFASIVFKSNGLLPTSETPRSAEYSVANGLQALFPLGVMDRADLEGDWELQAQNNTLGYLCVRRFVVTFKATP